MVNAAFLRACFLPKNKKEKELIGKKDHIVFMSSSDHLPTLEAREEYAKRLKEIQHLPDGVELKDKVGRWVSTISEIGVRFLHCRETSTLRLLIPLEIFGPPHTPYRKDPYMFGEVPFLSWSDDVFRAQHTVLTRLFLKHDIATFLRLRGYAGVCDWISNHCCTGTTAFINGGIWSLEPVPDIFNTQEKEQEVMLEVNTDTPQDIMRDRGMAVLSEELSGLYKGDIEEFDFAEQANAFACEIDMLIGDHPESRARLLAIQSYMMRHRRMTRVVSNSISGLVEGLIAYEHDIADLLLKSSDNVAGVKMDYIRASVLEIENRCSLIKRKIQEIAGE